LRGETEPKRETKRWKKTPETKRRKKNPKTKRRKKNDENKKEEEKRRKQRGGRKTPKTKRRKKNDENKKEEEKRRKQRGGRKTRWTRCKRRARPRQSMLRLDALSSPPRPLLPLLSPSRSCSCPLRARQRGKERRDEGAKRGGREGRSVPLFPSKKASDTLCLPLAGDDLSPSAYRLSPLASRLSRPRPQLSLLSRSRRCRGSMANSREWRVRASERRGGPPRRRERGNVGCLPRRRRAARFRSPRARGIAPCLCPRSLARLSPSLSPFSPSLLSRVSRSL